MAQTPDPKLDPRLAELIEARAGLVESTDRVDVLIALDAPIDDAIREDVTARGLSLRSEIGTVLTGDIVINEVTRLAESPHVVKLEASTPLYAEPQNPPPGDDYGEGPA